MSTSAALEPTVAWQPQPGPQTALINCPIEEILFGGARGGGKTDAVLGKYAIKDQRYGTQLNAVFFRPEMPQQDDLIERAKEIYLPTGAVWYEQRKTFRLPWGGRLRFRPLSNIQDAQKYQGQNVTDAAVEEAGNYADSAPIDRLFGCLRSAHGVPVQMILTANPGGPGHQWIKQRFIDPAPKGNELLTRTLKNGMTHRYIFIPSRVQDNRVLALRDPDYINRLHLVGSDELVRAWLEGDWSVVLGAYFDCWNPAKHVIRPFEIPKHWLRFRSGDWGSARPFSFGWWAVASENFTHPEGFVIPKGALVRYREWYGVVRDGQTGQITPNTGIKMPAEMVGEGLVKREKDDPRGSIRYGVIDPAAFASDGGPCIAERIYMGSGRKIIFRPADNRRVAKRGAIGGWDQVRGRLIGEDFGEPLGFRPMIYFFSTCTDTIRTLPALQHDETRPEDLDTNAEDHAADDVRYACMSRPWTIPAAQPQKPIDDIRSVTIGQLWKDHNQPTDSGLI